MRYFHTESASRAYPGGFRFNRYSIDGGAQLGVAAVDSPEQIAMLVKLAEDKSQPVTEITQEQYDECVKKKSPGLEDWTPREVLSPAIKTGPSIKTPTAVLVETAPVAEDQPVAIGAPVATTDEALSTGPVEKAPEPEKVVSSKKPHNFKK